MIIEFSEADDSRVRWNSGGEWKSADIDELIAAYERKCGKWGHNIGIGNVVIPAEKSESSLCDNCDQRNDKGCCVCKYIKERSEE